MSREYIVVAPHIVGDAKQWSMCYDSDLIRWSTREIAIRQGIKELDHDDFLLAIVEGDTLVGTAWQHEDRPEEHEEHAEMAEQLGLKNGAV